MERSTGQGGGVELARAVVRWRELLERARAEIGRLIDERGHSRLSTLILLTDIGLELKDPDPGGES